MPCLGEQMTAERVVCCFGRLDAVLWGFVDEEDPAGPACFLRLVDGLACCYGASIGLLPEETPPGMLVSDIDFLWPFGLITVAVREEDTVWFV